MTTVYVAGPSSEIDRCERAIALLRAQNIDVTHDWPRVMRAAGPESDLDIATLRGHLLDDINGALDADLLWLLLPSPGRQTIGAWVELGAVLGAAGARDNRIQIVASGPPVPFAMAFAEHFEYDHMALERIVGDSCNDDRGRLISALNGLLVGLGEDDRPRRAAIERAARELVHLAPWAADEEVWRMI